MLCALLSAVGTVPVANSVGITKEPQLHLLYRSPQTDQLNDVCVAVFKL